MQAQSRPAPEDFGSADIDKVRDDTAGVSNRVHFNNAGAALMPKPVVAGMIGYLQREAEIGGDEAAAENGARLDAVYDSIARLVGSSREEIALAEIATLAWQRAFSSLQFGRGDRILTTTAEFAANYIAFLQMRRRTGVQVDIIPDDANGALDPDALEAMIDAHVKLIAITWVLRTEGL